MIYIPLLSLLISAIQFNSPATQTDSAEPLTLQKTETQFETKPIWSEEFNYSGKPDPTKWNFETGGTGWGNHELQYYTDGKNAVVGNGYLTITAKKESYEGMNYTSARMNTKGKADFLYGRFEASLKIPGGKGSWPAFWMLPTDWSYGGWPNSGEIDIMENVGYEPHKIHVTIHSEANNHMKKNQIGTDSIIPTAETELSVHSPLISSPSSPIPALQYYPRYYT
jgi:beta-glucanase (GH16 family)